MNLFSKPLVGEYPGIKISSNKVDFEITEPNKGAFDFALSKAYISHALFTTNTHPVVLNGNFLLAIKNVETGAKKAITISGLFSIRSEIEQWSSSRVAMTFVDYLFNFSAAYLLQHGISESPKISFLIPANPFPISFFDSYFQTTN